MIRLEKGPIPPVLATSGHRWTQELLTEIASGNDPTPTQRNRYNHVEIKSALVTETHGKCAYCESKIRHIAPGDIEHIQPKSVKPELSFEWSNLTLACPICNTKKGAHEDILDPYAVDPGDHLLFLGPLIAPQPQSDLGRVTEVILDLNRSALLERRLERVRAIVDSLTVIEGCQSAERKLVLKNALLAEASEASAEYAACVRACIKAIFAATPDSDPTPA